MLSSLGSMRIRHRKFILNSRVKLEPAIAQSAIGGSLRPDSLCWIAIRLKEVVLNETSNYYAGAILKLCSL